MKPNQPPIFGHPRDCCIAIWRKTFEELLGSAEPALERTIDHWRKYMADENDMFYHEAPLHYATAELIHCEFPDWPFRLHRANLAEKLEAAITPAGDYPGRYCPDTDPSYDWAAARLRVRDVFDQWRHEFP
jgi:hypothetical protein